MCSLVRTGTLVAKFKLRKGISIGKLSAEQDQILKESFVDLGYLQRLLDPSDGTFLILGRAGSGKTALMRMIRERAENVSTLDPEELSMQYIHCSSLRTIASWGVNLEPFYKFLWRHVCILELIRMRYGDFEDVPSRIHQLFPIKQLFQRDDGKTRDISTSYLKEFGDDYWVKTDTRIKKLTTELEEQFHHDEKIGGKLKTIFASAEAGSQRSSDNKNAEKIEEEIVERAQEIVADFQIAALNRVVDLLGKHGFADAQNSYFIVIDDLDKEWMPDDSAYLELIKSLLFTVRDLNYKLQNAKIIVALRENIYHRVFKKSGKHEGQREKWQDVQVGIEWSRGDLIALVDKRLAAVFRGEYEKKAPTLIDLLPKKKRKEEEDGIDFIFSRTLMRPRDVIDFVNRCIAESDELTRFSYSAMQKAEVDYSEARLKWVFDEWKDSYYGLPALYPTLTTLGSRFRLEDFTEDMVYDVLVSDSCKECPWLRGLSEEYSQDSSNWKSIRVELVRSLFLVGIIGVKQANSHRNVYSFDRGFTTSHDAQPDSEYVVHKMFMSALGIFQKQGATAG